MVKGHFMIKKNLFLFLVLLVAMPSFAQKSIWLGAGGGLNFVHSFEQGTSALTYLGPGINIAPNFIVERPNFRYEIESRVMGDLCFNDYMKQGYEIDFDLRMEFMYRCYSGYDNRLRVWAGGDLQPFANFKLYSHLMNAAFGMTTFTNIDAAGLVQYDFAPSRDGNHYRFTTYAKLSLPLLSFVNRPGYAYIGNATSDLSGLGLLKDREHLTMFMPGARTDIGLFFNLPNKNKIGVSYRWDYLTTRHRGSHRFDHAIHTFNCIFLFNLL